MQDATQLCLGLREKGESGLKATNDRLGLVAVFLLVFIIVVGVTIWLLDLVEQQRIFGLLAAATLVAFAMLVGIYYEENPKDISRKWLTGGFAALVVLVLLAAALFVGIGSAPTSNVQVTLYAGEISTSLFGFGNTSTAITSPGPTLTFKVGDVVNVTLFNVGQMPHNWALVAANQTNGQVLFGSQIASGNVPVDSNQTGSVVFTVAKAGNYFYICQVAGHVQLGMWGAVVINP